MTKKWPKIKKVRYHKIKKSFVFWKVGSLLIMYPDMFFHDLFILDPKSRVKVKSICPKFKFYSNTSFGSTYNLNSKMNFGSKIIYKKGFEVLKIFIG